MNTEIANRLQQLRKSSGLSQEELAEKIGVSRQAVSKWERAEASPDTENLILLSKLYRMSLDELVNTNSRPISLKKENYGFENGSAREMRPDNYTEEEIYPGREETHNSIPQGAPFGADIGEEEKRSTKNDLGEAAAKAGRAVGDVINAAADGKGSEIPQRISEAGRAIGDVIGTAGQKISEEAKRPDLEDRFEKRMEKFGSDIEKMGRKIENKFDKWGEKMEEKERKNGYSYSSKQSAKKKKVQKPPATLFDKLFPIIIVSLFLLSCGLGIPHWGWVLFLLIPMYYTTKAALRKRNIMLFCYPLLCAIIYFGIGMPLMDLWSGLGELWMSTMWLLFLTIPLYYTGIIAVKKHNPLIFCYPVLCVILYLGGGIFLEYMWHRWGDMWFSVMWAPIFMSIPVYYIVITHYRQKAKADKGTQSTVSSAAD